MIIKKNKEKGFTLIEVMIVVAIIGILASIAYPSYVKSVQKGKRADAKVELLRIAQMQEGFFAQNMSYAANLAGLGLPTTYKSEQEVYSIAVAGLPAGCAPGGSPCTSFNIVATPLGSQLHDTECPRFTLTASGQKGTAASASADQIRRCWR